MKPDSKEIKYCEYVLIPTLPKPGDTVILRCGGPLMNVIRHQRDRDCHGEIVDFIECCWFDEKNGKYNTYAFDVKILCLLVPFANTAEQIEGHENT